jgi:hypothetical protein
MALKLGVHFVTHVNSHLINNLHILVKHMALNLFVIRELAYTPIYNLV